MTKLKPYPKYKDSGIEWIGDVPEGWNVCKLNLFGRLKGGFAFKATDFTYEGIPVVRMNNLKRGTLDFSNAAFVPQSVAPQEFCLNTGDILWGMSGSIGETGSLGNFARVREDDLPALLNQRVGKFVLNQKRLNSFFWEYYIQTNAFYEQIIIFSTGTAQFNVSSEQVESCSISLPPLSEQQAIAAYLDRETAQIDALIAKKARSIELLREKRQAMITHAVTKGLNPNAKMKDSGIEWIGEVPEGWAVKRLKWNTSLRKERKNYIDDGEAYIGLEDVESGSGIYKPTENDARLSDDSTVGVFYSNDILYGKLRPYLRKSIIATFNGVCSTEFLVLIPNKTISQWVQYWLLTPEVTQEIESGCEGAKMPRTDWEQVGGLPIPSPSLSEQQTIAAYLDNKCTAIDTLITKTERSVELLKEKRQALITAAVTGKIDVREAAPEAVCC